MLSEVCIHLKQLKFTSFEAFMAMMLQWSTSEL